MSDSFINSFREKWSTFLDSSSTNAQSTPSASSTSLQSTPPAQPLPTTTNTSSSSNNKFPAFFSSYFALGTIAVIASSLPLYLLIKSAESNEDAALRAFRNKAQKQQEQQKALVQQRRPEGANVTVHPSSSRNYIGIINQGATCYLASVLQTLFHIPHFTRRIFMLPKRKASSNSVAGQLQDLFAVLWYGKEDAASARKLLHAFGWSDSDALEQHDIHELLTLLRDHLQKKMRGTQSTQTMEQLFMGELVRFNRCLKVDHTTEEVGEFFFDLQLQVKGCNSIYDAFDKYLEPVRLEGSNGINTDSYGKQDVDRLVEFRKLPPVLMLHLMRFEYAQNPMTGGLSQRKIGDPCGFPKMLNLSKYVTGSDKASFGFAPPTQEYYLLSVLVHEGMSINAGHYFAYINTSADLSKDEWHEFNDDKVRPVTRQEAIEQNYSGARSPYMLVYVRKQEMEQIMRPVTEEEIPEFVKSRVEGGACSIM